MESSQGIYKRCEEPEEASKKPSSFLPQSCRRGSGISLPIIFLVNIASFLLWIIIIAVMTSKCLSTEKKLQQFDSNHSAQETVLNNNLKKLEDDHNSMKKDVNQNINRIETQSNKNVETVVKLINAVHKINASGCQICPKGWLLNRDKCYYFKMESQAWSFAHTKCEQYGGNLVVIDDWNEQSFLASQMKNKVFWIGLSDMSSENNFVWVDNSTPKFTHWNLGEPNNGGRGQDCVVMNSNGQWEDRECGKNVDGWICEKSWNC